VVDEDGDGGRAEMLVDGAGAGDLIRVQLASLEEYAGQLESQIHAVQAASARFGGTSNPVWGGAGFGEAAGLEQRHQQVLGQMRDLLAKVHDGIRIAKIAAHTVSANYQGADAFAKAKLDDVDSALVGASRRVANEEGRR
jgi:hypothetical protein